MSFKDLKVERMEGEEAALMLKLYPSIKCGYIKLGEKKWMLPTPYIKEGEKLYNFETRPDDTWIVTFPRSGTTVMQELVWLVANDLNFDEAHRKDLTERCPYIDASAIIDDGMFTMCTPDVQKMHKYSYEIVQDQSSPRFIKSHVPLELLPTVVNSNCKIIYVARNPKDMIISWYNFHKDMKPIQYKGTFEFFCDSFIKDYMLWSPYWEHVKYAWALRNRANMLFFFYEDLRKDLPGTIKKVATFFGKIYSNEQIAKLAEHLNIENFRKNSMVNRAGVEDIEPEKFIRQGKVGGWKEIFTPELEEKFNKWITDNLKDTDLSFPS